MCSICNFVVPASKLRIVCQLGRFHEFSLSVQEKDSRFSLILNLALIVFIVPVCPVIHIKNSHIFYHELKKFWPSGLFHIY
jgi:hypothetical protein